jgi:hypothetical protein
MKKPRGVGGKGDECKWQEKYGSVCWVPYLIYPPLQAAAHGARRFVPTPCAGHTQALTRGPRSRPSVSAGLRSGGTAARKWNVPHNPYARRPAGSGIVITTTSTPRDFRCAAPRQFIIMGMIASCPTTSNVQ